MSRDLIIAILASVFIHFGIAGSSYLVRTEPAAAASGDEEVPTIALDLPPPPEPEEPEIVEDAVSDSEPGEIADLAPPMQNDVPSAVIDSPFPQPPQPPVPAGVPRSDGPRIPPIPPRPGASAGKGLGNVFDLSALDKRPSIVSRVNPEYPFELRRYGIDGTVTVRFIVDSSGAVRDLEIIHSSNPAFERGVLLAVARWRFRPGEKGGRKVDTRMELPINFSFKANR